MPGLIFACDPRGVSSRPARRGRVWPRGTRSPIDGHVRWRVGVRCQPATASSGMRPSTAAAETAVWGSGEPKDSGCGATGSAGDACEVDVASPREVQSHGHAMDRGSGYREPSRNARLISYPGPAISRKAARKYLRAPRFGRPGSARPERADLFAVRAGAASVAVRRNDHEEGVRLQVHHDGGGFALGAAACRVFLRGPRSARRPRREPFQHLRTDGRSHVRCPPLSRAARGGDVDRSLSYTCGCPRSARTCTAG